MADLPAVKRRKFNHAASVLTRPFVSPFKHNKSPEKHVNARSLLSTVDVAEEDQSQQDSRLLLQSSPVPSSSQSNGPTDDTDTRRQIRRLEVSIKALRGDIDVLERATAAQSSGDEHLQHLIVKWRAIAQRAADELFPTVKDRMEGMGGLSALRQSRDSANGFAGQFNEDPKTKARHDDGGDSQVDRGCISPSQSEDSGRSGEICDEQQTLHDDDDNAFTMDKMLLSLNIDLDLIGFDQATQQWHEQS